MASQFFLGSFSQKTPNAAISDLTPPTFSGISASTANADGTFTVSWSAATDATNPIRYEVYIALGTVSAASLFVSANVSKVVQAVTQTNVGLLGDQVTYMLNGQTYTLGVRAVDASGNRDSNNTVLTRTAIGSGNLAAVFQAVASQLTATELLLAADHTNFQADHANFVLDLAALNAANAVYANNNTNFSTYLVTLNGYLGTLATSLTTLSSLNTSLSSTATNLASTATNLASTATSLSNTQTDLQDNVDQFGVQLTTFAGDLTTFAGYLSTLNTDISGLATAVTDIEAAAVSVNNAASLIIATVL